MLHQIFTVHGSKLMLSCNKDFIFKWNKENHVNFSSDFKKLCFTLLCIQKRFRHIDKNIFLLFMEKVSRNDYSVIDKSFVDMLYFMNSELVDYQDLCDKLISTGVINDARYLTCHNLDLISEEFMGKITIGTTSKNVITFSVRKYGQIHQIYLIIDITLLDKYHWSKTAVSDRITDVITKKKQDKKNQIKYSLFRLFLFITIVILIKLIFNPTCKSINDYKYI